MSNTLLEIKTTIKTNDGSTTTKISESDTTNNTLPSLFSQLDVMLNDVAVSSASRTYRYRAYIEYLLNYGFDANKSRLESTLDCIDDIITVADTIPEEGNEVLNSGLNRRYSICTGRGSFDMIGPLHADIFVINRYLINGGNMRMKLSRSKDAFVLMGVRHQQKL